MIYLDSSALLKLVLDERESDILDDWLGARVDTPATSSELARVEMIRGCRRADAERLPKARAILAAVDLLPLTGGLLEDATEIGDPTLRSLDAIHLASALSIREELSAFVAYDRRLADAAGTAGLPVVAPGT